MSINARNIKRWILMLTGKSVYHVKQGLGSELRKDSCYGYYNDLRQKVIQGESTLDETGLPVLTHTDGSRIHMPTMIFQYGLGAFDLWLNSEKKEEKYLSMAVKCAEWALNQQMDNGAWNTFFYIYPEHPYSAMPQGEGASLLLRVFSVSNDRKYFDAAKKAVDFLLLDVHKGGVASYEDGLIFLEYTHMAGVLNGWIFALWGLYDFCFFSEEAKYKEALKLTLTTLKLYLPQYDNGYWSFYNLDGMVTSPFYHHLHIAQLEALYLLFGDEIYNRYFEKFTCYGNKIINCCRAFMKKALQKIGEKG